MKRVFALLPAAVLAFVSGCSAGVEAESCEDSAPAAGASRARNSVSYAREYAPARKAAPAFAPGKPAGGSNFTAPAGQKMAFTAHLRLSVSEIRPAIDQARELALKTGGYVKRMDDASVTLAIPIAKAEQALADLKKIGVVNSLRIEGVDVTQQVTDIAVRLENLEKSRKRLLALLEKAGKVDEMIKVENAIARVTTELERLQAQQKNLQGRVDYVTMYVTFSAAVRQIVRRPVTPVGWVNDLGSELLNFNVKISYGSDPFVFDLALPAGFVKSNAFEAVSGGNCILALRKYPNAVTAAHWYGDDYAKLGFYIPIIEKALSERFQTAVTVEKCRIDDEDAAVFTVKPVIGKNTYVYKVVAAAVDSDVFVLTARGESREFDRVLPEKAWKKLLGSVEF